MRKSPCVYILASGRNGTLYIGVTSDIVGRVSLHKQDLIDGFSKRYRVHRLVYVEYHGTMVQAIAREKQLKRWQRTWKIDLIERENPTWKDLYWDVSGLVEGLTSSQPGEPPPRHPGQATLGLVPRGALSRDPASDSSQTR